jgi:hypothetical protein
MKVCLRLLTLAALLLLPACGGRDTAPPSAGTTPGKSNNVSLADRHEAAAAIHNGAQRDQALAAVAVDAGRAGDAEIAKKSVQAINNTNVRDDAAFNTAVELARAGKGQDATAVAQMINNSTKKDEALAKIAKGG